MSGQSKKHSLYEIAINIVIGFSINLAIQAALLPIYGAHVSLMTNFNMGLIFTVVAVIRSYYLRRLFNYLTHTPFGQHPRHSFYESFCNITIGYFTGLVSQLFIFPIFGVHLSISDNVEIALVISTVSIIRSFILRRIFNKLTVEKKSTRYYLNRFHLSLVLFWYEIKSRITS